MTLKPAYGESGGGGSGGVNWTTSEQDTGKTFTAGEIVYQKTILHTSNLAAGTTMTTIAHGITGMAQMLSAEITAERSNGDFLALPYLSTSAGFNIEVRYDGTNIYVTPGTGWTATGSEILNNLIITLTYTKT